MVMAMVVMVTLLVDGSGKSCDDFVVTAMVVIVMVMVVIVMVMVMMTVVIVMVLVEVVMNNNWWNIFCNQNLNSLHHTNLRL